jgi:hypothetical protein
VADARPVRRLRPPALRAALWLLLTVLIFGLLALGHGLRPDLALRLGQPSFIVGTLAALLTGVLAAVAAFMLNLPDRSRGWALLPVPALIVWVGSIGYGCLTQWVSLGPQGIELGETARCFATVLTTSVPLSLAMFVMLRHGSMLNAAAATLTGSVAVAGVVASAMSTFHNLDASVMILVWNMGTAAVIVTLGGWLGHRLESKRAVS